MREHNTSGKLSHGISGFSCILHSCIITRPSSSPPTTMLSPQLDHTPDFDEQKSMPIVDFISNSIAPVYEQVSLMWVIRNLEDNT